MDFKFVKCLLFRYIFTVTNFCPSECRIYRNFNVFKGTWKRKMTWVGKVIVIQVLYGIVAIGGYFKLERVISL
jgi:hypothetical protein